MSIEHFDQSSIDEVRIIAFLNCVQLLGSAWYQDMSIVISITSDINTLGLKQVTNTLMHLVIEKVLCYSLRVERKRQQGRKPMC